jgi:DnaD/phage-associated family protein
MRRLRDERQKEEYYQPVTDDVTKGNADTDTDKDIDTDTEGVAEIFTFYENNIEMLTPRIREEINDAITDYPPSWIMDSMKIAVDNNKRSWGYCRAILKRWKREGKDDGKAKVEKAAAVY